MSTKNNTEIETYANEQYSKLLLSTKLGLLTLLNGKKWMIYVFLAILPILISWVSKDYLFGNEDAETAFVDVYIGFFFIFMFPFGAMLISLPVSSDEISDNIIDLYLVRPIRRDVYWTSRWISVNIGVNIINAGIVTFYWIYFNLIENGSDDIPLGIAHIFSDIFIYFKMLYLIFWGAMVYSGLFLLIGSIGSRGFTIGMMVALLETFFVSLLFLSGSAYIPRTHLNNLSYDIFKREQLRDLTTDFSMTYAYGYLISFALIFYLMGIWYFKRKEFN
ncbi:MAG: hypothetical protein HeimC2_13160 [Candidatus Heimdallarchaeota archaeon LC_2]|nr:MAG: hypothetical protein HeimC2_13160 [Candidatus Heimdallarchaeota archaeon LC_2]